MLSALLGFLILALLAGIGTFFRKVIFNLTKDEIEFEKEKKQFLERKFSISDSTLKEVFRIMEVHDHDIDKSLYLSANPTIVVQRPKKKSSPWLTYLVTFQDFKEGLIIKSSKVRYFTYVINETSDDELDQHYRSSETKISSTELAQIMMNQTPIIEVED